MEPAENPRDAALLASPVRRAIVDHLAAAPPEFDDEGHPEQPGRTAAQLAEQLELHVTTVRFHLDQLVAGGLVSAEFTRRFGVGRPRKVYALVPGNLDESRDHESLKILTALLADSFGDPALTPAEAGSRWARANVTATQQPVADSPGKWLTKVAQMIDVLHDWGYSPDLSTTEGGRAARIELAHCPFLDLARVNAPVVCGIHRGLIAGTMESLGEHDIEVSLQPFVGPSLCLAHVRTRTAFVSAHSDATLVTTAEPEES